MTIRSEIDPRANPRNWLILHIFIPMAPALLGGIIRMAAAQKLYWAAFSASDFAICAGLLALFVYHSLLKTERLLPDDETKYETRTQSIIFLVFAFFFAVFFALVVGFEAAFNVAQVYQLEWALHTFQIITLVGWLFLVVYARSIQRSYKLKARIL